MKNIKLSTKTISLIILFGILISNISCNKDPINEAPQKPNLLYPANNSVHNDIPYKLGWSCFDKDQDKLTYELYFGTENPPKLFTTLFDKHVYTEGLPIESNKTYFWKIIAEDEKGERSESDIWSFSIGNLPPGIPFNPFPGNNSMNQNPSSLTWECNEPNGELLFYNIYFGKPGNMLLIEQDFSENSYAINNLTGNQSYAWRLDVNDSFGNIVDGPIWSFTTSFIPPKLILPANGEENGPWFPKLQWFCDNTETLTYDIYLGTSNSPELLASDITENYYHTDRLLNNQTYYWKIIAKKTDGSTIESSVWSFKVFGDPIISSFTDTRDWNTYLTVTIGNQTWMAENLKYNLAGSKVYDDNPLNEDIYGRLYNWEQIMNGENANDGNPSGVQGIAPAGWHIPSNSEWNELIDFLGGEDEAGGELKEEGTDHWNFANGTNESGFTALAGGIFNTRVGQVYEYMGRYAAFHSCSKNKMLLLIEDNNNIINYREDCYNSLRCVKN